MDKYLDTFREMISLRGLSEHTTVSYCTYIRAYLGYLSSVLHKQPEDVSWEYNPANGHVWKERRSTGK